MTPQDPSLLPRPSAIAAAERAMEETGRSLFPVKLEVWFALGFLTFLDQCGRSGGGGNFNPGSGGSGSGSGSSHDGAEALERGLAWLGEHALLAAGIAAAAIAFVIALTALVLWINSRGTFMYLDAVATRRSDIVRPWREHAARAGSYFAWQLGLTLVSLVVILTLLVPIGWSVFTLMRHGTARGVLAVVVLVVAGLVALAFVLAMSLLSVALRDFAAPIQWYEDVSCTDALRQVRRLVTGQPMLFVVYVLLKMALHVGVAIVAFALCCMTCCCGVLPVIFQTVLQPVFYFERRWSLELLHALGYAPPGGAAPPAPLLPPLEPPPLVP